MAGYRRHTFANNAAYEQYQIINDGMHMGQSLAVSGGTTAATGGFPYGYSTSGTVSFRPLSRDYSVIVWQTPGICNAGDRPPDFNTLGRILIEIDPGVSSRMFQWDGSAWIVL